jgi:amidase
MFADDHAQIAETGPAGGQIVNTATQPDASWDYRTTKELVAALHARKISAIELTDHVIARIEALDPTINAVVR